MHSVLLAGGGATGSVLLAVAEAFSRGGIDLRALGLAWARVMPSVVLVPAFGLKALPASGRALLGLTLAACVFPALEGLGPAAGPVVTAPLPWAAALVAEVVRGLPVAVAAAVPLWAAGMAGGVADALRGSQDVLSVPIVEGRSTPLGVPLSLLACVFFFGTGGPAWVLSALVLRPLPSHPVSAAAADLVGGITLAVALAGPLLAAAVVIEVAAALVARAASPAQVHALLAPLRALGTLAVFGVVLERIASVLAAVVERP